MWDKHMPLTQKKASYAKPLTLSGKLLFNVGNTSLKIQRESEETILKSESEIKISQRASFSTKKFITCQISN